MPLTGLEPVRSCPQRILSPRCLPFHHNGVDYRFILAQFSGAVKKQFAWRLFDKKRQKYIDFQDAVIYNDYEPIWVHQKVFRHLYPECEALKRVFRHPHPKCEALTMQEDLGPPVFLRKQREIWKYYFRILVFTM